MKCLLSKFLLHIFDGEVGSFVLGHIGSSLSRLAASQEAVGAKDSVSWRRLATYTDMLSKISGLP
jgi:hypothetical protein